MLSWIKHLFLRGPRAPRPPHIWRPDEVDHEDPMVREAIAHVMNTGDSVIGNRRRDGSFDIRIVAPTYKPRSVD